MTTNQKAKSAEDDDMGFHPGFPPGFDPKRAERGLGQIDCVCGCSRGRHITAIHGQPLGKCHGLGCGCEGFVEAKAADEA